jgi:hypothetical protein
MSPTQNNQNPSGHFGRRSRHEHLEAAVAKALLPPSAAEFEPQEIVELTDHAVIAQWISASDHAALSAAAGHASSPETANLVKKLLTPAITAVAGDLIAAAGSPPAVAPAGTAGNPSISALTVNKALRLTLGRSGIAVLRAREAGILGGPEAEALLALRRPEWREILLANLLPIEHAIGLPEAGDSLSPAIVAAYQAVSPGRKISNTRAERALVFPPCERPVPEPTVVLELLRLAERRGWMASDTAAQLAKAQGEGTDVTDQIRKALAPAAGQAIKDVLTACGGNAPAPAAAAQGGGDLLREALRLTISESGLMILGALEEGWIKADDARSLFAVPLPEWRRLILVNIGPTQSILACYALADTVHPLTAAALMG